MLVNFKRKLIFIHIPKNAGTTFKNILYSTHGDTEWKKPFTDEKKYTHAPLKSFLASYPEHTDFKVITIVRNPYERAISWFTYYRTSRYQKRHPQMRAIYYAQKSFLDFLEWYERSFKSKWEMIPQVWWFKHRNKVFYDYQVRFENLNTDLESLFGKLEMNLPFEIPHNNKSDETFTFEETYNDESLAIINKWYKEDFEILGYDKR